MGTDTGHPPTTESCGPSTARRTTGNVDDLLTVIRGYVQLLNEDPSVPAASCAILAEIACAADSAIAAYRVKVRSHSHSDPRAGVPRAGARPVSVPSATAELADEHAGPLREGASGPRAVHALFALSEGLTDGVAMTDALGRVVHANAVFGRLLADERDGPTLRTLLDDVVRTLTSAARRRPDASAGPLVAARERRTDPVWYRVRGAWLADNGGAAGSPAALVTVTVEGSCPGECDPELRFGLTPREGEVARLLARGLTNAQLATALEIRTNTVKRHTERVLAKLGVHSRAAVADALQRAGALERSQSVGVAAERPLAPARPRRLPTPTSADGTSRVPGRPSE